MDPLEHGRQFSDVGAGGDAYQWALCADPATSLRPDNLDRLATAAFLTGHDLAFQRAAGTPAPYPHRSGRPTARRAVCIWLALFSLLRGEVGPANAWIARGQRLVDDRDCADRGYVLIAVSEQQLRDHQAAAAHATACQAAGIGGSSTRRTSPRPPAMCKAARSSIKATSSLA